ncbi:MAG: histidine kinase [Carboxylicivirga sp.]|nr:histidine kinase [Carboxylicivirga sp.]
MRRVIFKRWHLMAMIVLVMIFAIGTYWIKQRVQYQTNLLSKSIIHGSTLGYQKFLDNYFDNYDQIISQVAYVYDKIDIDTGQKQSILRALLESDSTLVAIGILDNGRYLESIARDLKDSIPDFESILKQPKEKVNAKVFSERFLFVGNSGSNKSYGILIDLQSLHKQFIWGNIYTSVYQVVINLHEQCIYHPDINRVGKTYALPKRLLDNVDIEHKQLDTLHLAQSDFLQLPVFKQYKRMNFRNDTWFVLNVSPGFEVKDMVAEQERNMFLLFFLFLAMLLLIIVISIINWKREFLLRANAEQEHLNLQLKHEKQKSETISIKLELLRSGLNSHFMFNSLGTVKALMRKNADAARDMLKDLSQLYRYQLTIEGEQMVTLQDELNFTQKYVDVINLRSNSSIVMNISGLNDYLDYKVLPVSLQLLVENCIKHNIASETQPLSIDIDLKDGRIIVENELRPKETIGEASGKGLKNLNARYKLLAEQECTFIIKNGRFIATMPLIN